MATKIQVKRGVEFNRSGQTPDVGEFIYTTDTKKLTIGDGITAGGNKVLMGSDVDNIPSNSAITDPISSSWAYGHENAADPHSAYPLAADNETISGQWTFAGASYVFNNTTAQIRLDSSSQKGIYCNDGAGNFVIRAGNRQYDPGGGADERYPVAGDGAVKEVFSTDAQAGKWSVLAAAGTAALADDPVNWSGAGAIYLDSSGFYFGTAASENGRILYQNLDATITANWDFQATFTIDRVGLAAQGEVVLDTDAGYAAVGLARTGGLNRWKWGKDNSAEIGSDVGGNFSIQSYTDAGVLKDTPLQILRANGSVSLSGALTVAGAGTFSSTISAEGTIQSTGGILYANRQGDSADASVVMNADAGQLNRLSMRTAGQYRWNIDKTATAETGSNVGSDLSIDRYSDAGTNLGPVVLMNRATGQVKIPNTLYVVGVATFDENPTLDKIGDAEDATWQTASDAGNFAGLRIQTGTTLRWLVGKNYQAETGSDAGSNFQIRRYNDAGTYQDTPLTIQRSDGQITLSGYTQVTNFLELERTTPQIRFYETDAAVDEQRWRWVADSGTMGLWCYSNDELTYNSIIRFQRSGATPSQISAYCSIVGTGNISTNGGYMQISRTGDAADGVFYLDRDAGKRGLFVLRSGTSQRWQLECNSAAEAGSDAGSDFLINRFDDSGILIDTAVRIWRATGNMHVYNDFYPEGNVVMNGGFLHINRAGDTAAAHLYLSGDAGQNRLINFRTGSSMRWQVLADNAAESGSDAGSDFRIARYNDSGIYQDNSLKIVRSTGDVEIANNLQVGKTVHNDALYDNGNSGTAKTIDWGLGNAQEIDLTGDVTLTFTNPGGPCFVSLKLTQDATGSRTVTWPSSVKTSGGSSITISSGATNVSVVVFWFDGTDYILISNPSNIS